MSIKKIDKNELRGYEGKEGLILQGCGGNPQEWVDGINDLFTKEGFLLDGTKFSDDNCAVFENNGLTCMSLTMIRKWISANSPCGESELIRI